MILLVMMLSGCFEQPDCLINNTNSLKIALKGKTLGKDTIVTFISIRALKVEGTLYAKQPLSSLEIPIQINDSVTTVIFDYTDKKAKLRSDTLVVGYRNELRVISPDCGAYLYQHDLNVPKTNFEKTRVTVKIIYS